jgi:hypothetical protein
MVNNYRIVPICLIYFALGLSASGQSYLESKQSLKRITILTKAVSVFSGKFETSQGNYAITGRSMFTGQLGLQYLVFTEGNLNFSVGVLLGIPPVFHFEFPIEGGSVYPEFTSDERYNVAGYGFYSLHAPLTFKYAVPISNKLALTASGGLQYTFIPLGTTTTEVGFANPQNQSEIKDIFTFEASNTGNGHYLGALLGFGIEYLTRIGRFGFSFEYHQSFQNVFDGEYWFGNFMNQLDSRGNYSLNNDYLSFNLSYTWFKKQPSLR